jgi:formylglycine-generating enzyme required for sulfatase activity
LSVVTSLLSIACASHSGAAAANGADASTAPSCKGGGPGLSDCGAAGDTCCASLPVTGGTFDRSYDGISTNGASRANPATVSDFSLDKYEVTVGRFRVFVAAEVAGWRPGAGAGKHTSLPHGGLNDGKEPGWESSWNVSLATTESAWAKNLACVPTYSTWTDAAGSGDDRPINCVTWYEAYAFCIWDGGFLPTEAEWNYAAAGGADQRVYPWSAAFPPGSTTLDCAHANYSTSWPSSACVQAGATKVGAESPLGDGKWGQADLAGNVFEWNLDSYDAYAATCDDCADLSTSAYKVIRGGSFDGESVCLLNSLRETSVPDGRSDGIGVRCARTP